MANQYLAGIDIGTTGAKTGIFDLAGHLLGSGYREYTCQYPKPNWVEQDPELLVAEAMRSASEAVGKAHIAPHAVAGIALSTQRCCSIFVDAQGRSLRPMISWQDNRTSAEVEEMRGLISGHEYYRL